MLTKINPDGTWSCQEVDFKELKGNMYGALCKLRDYEKSGFEPGDLERITEKIRIGSVIQRYTIFGIMNNCCIAENKNAPETYVVWTIDYDRNGVRNGNYFCDFPDAYVCFFSLSGMIPPIVEDYWKR